MKRLTVFLLVLVLVSGSCKDEEIFGSLVVIVGLSDINGQPILSAVIGIYDPNPLSGDPLYTQGLRSDRAEFKELNPGNYRVAVVGTNYHCAAQVKAGKQVSVTIN